MQRGAAGFLPLEVAARAPKQRILSTRIAQSDEKKARSVES